VPAVGRARKLALTLFILCRCVIVLIKEGASLLRRLLAGRRIQHVCIAILAREESALRHVRAFARIIEHASAPLFWRGTLALRKEDDALLVHLRCRHLVLSGQCLLELHLLLGTLLLVRQDRVLTRASGLLADLLMREGRQRRLLLVRRNLH